MLPALFKKIAASEKFVRCMHERSAARVPAAGANDCHQRSIMETGSMEVADFVCKALLIRISGD